MPPVKLSYDVYDSEEARFCPIILMHGLFWNKFMFRDVAQDLARATKRKVFCLDLRNHGESPVCEEVGTLLMAEDVQEFMADLSLEKISFVCHSMSCTVAYVIAARKPDVVEKIVMIDCVPWYPFDEARPTERVLSQVVSQNRLLNRLDSRMTVAAAKAKILDFAAFGTEGQAHFFKKVSNDLTKVNDKFQWKIDLEHLMKRYSEKAFRPDPMGTSDHDILVVRCVDSTRVTESTYKETLKYCPKARLETIDNSTHLLMFEQKQRFTTLVKEFLSTSE